MPTPRIRTFCPRFVACVMVFAVVAMAAPLAFGSLGRKAPCEVKQVFIEEISIRKRSGIDTEQVVADYRSSLENALRKKKLVLVESLSALGPQDVALNVSIRAWIDRTQTKRALLSLAAGFDVDRTGQEIWSGDVNPGGASKLLNFKHSDPGNLAKKTADRFLDACRSDWSEEP